jgi:RNA polymerase sigma-70 factor (ECF subfamily)
MAVEQISPGRCVVATILECESTVAPRRVPIRGRIDRDAELVQSLRRGEPSAADRLVTTYQSRAYRLACGITGNTQDAEEVVQDAFYTVVARIDTFRAEASFGSWLYRIVANGACQKLRQRRWHRQEIALDEVLPVFDDHGRHVASCHDWSTTVDGAFRSAELRHALNAALDELPPHYRTVLVLRDVEGVSVAEIAETVGLSVENVKSRIHRARLFVRKRLTESMAVTLVA